MKRLLNTVKQNMREANIAYCYARKKAEQYERMQRELEYKWSVEDMERERKVLGYKAKEMLQQADSHMYRHACVKFKVRSMHSINDSM